MDLGLVHPLLTGFGGSINLFQRYLAPAVAENMTPDLRNTLADLDRQSLDKVNELLNEVGKLLAK